MNLFSPLEDFSHWLVFSWFGIQEGSVFGGAAVFFLHDIIKIFILISVIVFIVSFLRTFLPPEKIRAILARNNQYVGNVLASLLGIATPFCSCSAIPLFLGFIQAGVPLGVTFSFLVASPMINEVALGLLLSSFGIRIAVIYVLSGLMIAIISGIIIGKLKPEGLIEEFVLRGKAGDAYELPQQTMKERVQYARSYTAQIIKKIWPYIVVGVGVGAWIHGYAPADVLATYAGKGSWFAVPFATLIGIPLYSNAAGIIPLVGTLTAKGVAMGTALAFMMSVTALSLPEFMILKKVMKVKLIMLFAGIVGVGIIATGYIFNWIIG